MKEQELNDPYFYLTDSEVEEMRESEKSESEIQLEKAIEAYHHFDTETLLDIIIQFIEEPGVNHSEIWAFLQKIKEW
jgi:hypothetical protein